MWSVILATVFLAAAVQRRMISVPQLAREWGVSSKKVTAFIAAGELRACNFATSAEQRPRYMVSREAVAEFEELRQVVPSEPPAPRCSRRRRDDGIKKFV